jgi:hypothetical protein
MRVSSALTYHCHAATDGRLRLLHCRGFGEEPEGPNGLTRQVGVDRDLDIGNGLEVLDGGLPLHRDCHSHCAMLALTERISGAGLFRDGLQFVRMA